VFSEAFAPSATPPQEDTLQQPTPIGRKPPAVADPEEDPLQQPAPIGRKNSLTLLERRFPQGDDVCVRNVRLCCQVVYLHSSVCCQVVYLHSQGRIGQGMYVLAAGDRDKKGVVERDHGTGSRTPYRVRWSDGDSDWLRPEDIVLDEAAAEENRAAAEALAAEERARSDASCERARSDAPCCDAPCCPAAAALLGQDTAFNTTAEHRRRGHKPE